MQYLLLLLFVPFVVPIIAKWRWHSEITYHEMFLQMVLIMAGVIGLWYGGRGLQMMDHEVWNGEIVSKSRDHGQYTESYSCNCSGSGKTRSCRTCYRQHYTVTWSAKTTVGGIRFDHADWTSPAVYALPDPQVYRECQKGQPASIEHTYMNYVKGANQSLFHRKRDLSAYPPETLPEYPRVYNFYQYNRVIDIESGVDALKINHLNDEMNVALKKLGREKEVNVLFIVTKKNDPQWRFAIADNWLGGKKNDVLIFLGMDGDKLAWSEVRTWADNYKNETLAVTLRDALKIVPQFDAVGITTVTSALIRADYTRPQMKDFEYLLDEITPANWCMVIILLLVVGGSIGLTVWFHREDVNFWRGCGKFVDIITRR